MKYLIFLFVFFLSSGTVSAQDTFYVKKNRPARITAAQATISIDSMQKDSLISYTMEYQKPGSNLYVMYHGKGPHFDMPYEATQGGNRILFTEIIRMDKNGRRYRQPDMYYAGGYWVPVKTPK